MKHTHLCLGLIIFMFCIWGCPEGGGRGVINRKNKPLNSEFKWRSENPDGIWIDNASGFNIDPQTGILTGLSSKGLVLPPQPFPPETTITWWYGERRDRDTATHNKETVVIPARPIPNERFTLIFTFKSDETWEAHWERPTF